jgi:signal transduction histidine kinase
MAALALMLALGSAPAPAHADGVAPGANVLMLYGLDPYIPTFLAMDKAMREDLARTAGPRIHIFSESLDAQRFAMETLEPEMASLFARKYRALPVKVVVAVSRTALEFFQRHGAQLWPDARLVYVGFLGYEFSPAALPRGASAVLSILDVAGTIDIARQMQPRSSRIVVISGASEIDRRAEKQARDALADSDSRVTVEYLSGLPLQELVVRVAREPADSIVVYLSQFRDRNGGPYEPLEVLRNVVATSQAPVYGAAEPYIGLGVAAGSVSSYADKGRLVSKQVRSALSTEPTDPHDVMLQAPNRCVADARALKRWSLDARLLPRGCVIQFATVPVWRQYWWQIALALVVVSAEAALIVALFYQRRRRQRAEQSEQAHRAELAHAGRLSVAGELTGAIAHEINQPLGAILSNADAGDLLLDSGFDHREKLREIFADIRRDDLRASEVIQHLRDLLRKHPSDRKPFDMNDVVTDLESIMRAEARRRGVALGIQRAPGALIVLGDRIQVQQVLINLVLNAMDAVHGQPEPRRTVTVSVGQRKRNAVLTVADSGLGIAPEHQGRIFESFYSTKGTGMGLGLSITRTIVESHGGRVWIEVTGNEGTEFRAELPLASVKTAA